MFGDGRWANPGPNTIGWVWTCFHTYPMILGWVWEAHPIPTMGRWWACPRANPMILGSGWVALLLNPEILGCVRGAHPRS